MACGTVACGLGLLGIAVPVLPTTPFLLLAAFLFSRSSERMNAWLRSTKAYHLYVEPFKESGGIPMRRKVYILAVSYAVMGVSAILVCRWYVWTILGCVAIFLAWLMLIHIPTVVEVKAKEGPAEALKSCE